MSQKPFAADAGAGAFNQPHGTDRSLESKWSYIILWLILFLIGAIGAAAMYRDNLFAKGGNTYVATAFSVVLSVFLAFLPTMICAVRNTTKRRQLTRLISLTRFPVAKSTYYQSALTSVNNEQIRSVIDNDFLPPLIVYFFIVLVGFVASLLGYSFPNTFTVPSFILSGLHKASEPDFANYQIGTFCVAVIAFFAAYIYSLGRLLDRVNNNDLYPISLYYYAVRAVIACVAAAIMRHTADVFNLDSSSILLIIAFGIGFAPDLFIIAMTRRAFQAIKVWGSRDDPSPETRPRSLPLLMIDDLSREKIDRLNELGIDSAQVLARQNPFLLLTRLPYELGLLVDWIAQAQLYVLVKDARLEALRTAFIRDVCDLHTGLQTDNARPGVLTALGIDPAGAASLLHQLDQDPSFVRLKEVRDAMVEKLAAQR